MLLAYKRFWQRTFHFKCVATRSEYWWAFLVNLIFEAVFQAMQYLRSFDYNDHPSARVGTGNPHMNHWLFAGGDDSVLANTFAIIAIIFMFATLIPKLSIAIRRSHDFNWSAHWVVALWSARLILFLFMSFEVIMLVINDDSHHMNAAMGNFLWGLLAFSIFFILQVIELIILTKKSKRPNRFVTDHSSATTVDATDTSTADAQ